VKPFNNGASTHRWAHAPLKGLTAALLVGCRHFTRSHAEQRRQREEKRKGLAVALSSQGRHHLGLARRAAVGVSSHWLRRRVRKRKARVLRAPTWWF
jgi:predicted ATPase